MRFKFRAAILLLIFQFSLGSIAAQTPGAAYVIQGNEWLSNVAEKAYGNPHLYYQIVEATNEKAKSDVSFATISNPNRIETGHKLWIPKLPSSQNLTGVPKSNCEIRLWYNFQVVAIGKINKKWAQDGIDLKTRAHKAYEMRHQARVNARFMMQNKNEVKELQSRDMDKYGNPDGPTFEYLLKKSQKNASLEEAYQAIIDSSSRTDSAYNADCQ